MQHFLKFKLEAISTTINETDKAKGVKSILSFRHEEIINGLTQVNIISIKSQVEVDPKLYLNKMVTAEVLLTIISADSKFSKPKVYYKALNLKIEQ